MSQTQAQVQCIRCGEDYPLARRMLGFLVCPRCGEADARQVRHCVVPMHKSNLVVVSPRERKMLAGISNKGGQISGGGQNSDSPTAPAGRNCLVVDSEGNYVKVTRAEMIEIMQRHMDKALSAPPRKSAVRRITLLDGGKVDKPTRRPWHKRSEPAKK